MRKVLLFTLFAAILVGCNSPINKSVTEDLSVEEIESINEKYPLFLLFYKTYFETKQYKDFLSDKTAQVLYNELTYKRFYNYIIETSDENYINSIYDEAEKEWKEKFSYTEQKFDSIITYWQNYVNENSLETYLDIEFDHATAHKLFYSEIAVLYFKLTPKKGELLSIGSKYIITTKEDSTVQYKSTLGYPYSFSKTIIDEEECYFHSKNTLFDDIYKNKLSSIDIKEKYRFEYNIEWVQTEKDGYISEKSIEESLPKWVGDYLKTFSPVAKDNIIEEYIDKNYKSLYHSKDDLLQSRMEEKDPLCYGFIAHSNSTGYYLNLYDLMLK